MRPSPRRTTIACWRRKGALGTEAATRLPSDILLAEFIARAEVDLHTHLLFKDQEGEEEHGQLVLGTSDTMLPMARESVSNMQGIELRRVGVATVAHIR